MENGFDVYKNNLSELIAWKNYVLSTLIQILKIYYQNKL